MDEQSLKAIASQLRQPHGEHGKQVGEKMNEGNLHINRYAIETLDVSPNDNILEIGMGNGFFIKDIVAVDDSVRYSGCDFSELMIDEASSLNADLIASGKVQLSLANAENLPFGDNIFNKVFTINTIYFWDDPQKVLSEIRRVLKDQGKLLVAVRPESLMRSYPFVKYGFHMFSKESLSKLLSENGFTVIHTSEKTEPEQEVFGKKVKVETLIVTAQKV